MKPSDSVVERGFIQTETERAPTVERSTAPAVARKARPGFVDIRDVIKQREATQEGSNALKSARKELGQDLQSAYGASLKTIRMARGISQAALGEKIGTTQPHIARIESGREDVQVTTLLRIAKALDVPVGEVFSAFVDKFERA